MICEACGRDHEGGYGKGRFCNSECKNLFLRDQMRKKLQKGEALPPNPKGGAGRKLSEETKRKISAANKGRVLSKTSIDRIRVVGKGRKHSEESKRKMSEVRKEGYSSGRITPAPGVGRGKKGRLDGIWFDSSWELAYLIFCRETGLPIRRSGVRIKYQLKGEEHTYIPDFILESGEIVEIKGWLTRTDEAKIQAALSQGFRLKILGKTEMLPIIRTVVEKYGEKFWENKDLVGLEGTGPSSHP